MFFRDGWLVVPDIRKTARDHRRSRLPSQHRPVMIILFILCIHVQKSGHDDSLFHSRTIRSVVGIGGD